MHIDSDLICNFGFAKDTARASWTTMAKMFKATRSRKIRSIVKKVVIAFDGFYAWNIIGLGPVI